MTSGEESEDEVEGGVKNGRTHKDEAQTINQEIQVYRIFIAS